jgi:hypothetical protein
MTETAQLTHNCIDAARPNEQYLISWGSDRDRDVFTAEKILTAIRGNEAIELGMTTARKLFVDIGEKIDQWVKQYHQAISRGWMTEREGALLFIVVSDSASYNEGLHDSLIDLAADINVQMGAHPIRVRTLLLPGIGEKPERAFLSHHMCHQIYPASE